MLLFFILRGIVSLEAKNGCDNKIVIAQTRINKCMFNNNQGIDIEIRVNGRPVRSYNHEGKVFIESRENSEYTIHVKNNNYYRVLAVPSIDGISVLDGEKASHNSIGYILDAYQAYEIKGFRKDLENVGAFKFVKKAAGYAAVKGDSKNVGVISLAVFKEKVNQTAFQWTYTYNSPLVIQPTVWTMPIYNSPTFYTCSSVPDGHMGSPCSLNNSTLDSNITLSNCSSQNNNVFRMAPQAAESDIPRGREIKSKSLLSTAKPSFSHSTNWGKKIEDKVTSGNFERDLLLAEFNIYYGSKNDLKLMGIEIDPKKEVGFPKGFDNKFCTPPNGW